MDEDAATGRARSFEVGAVAYEQLRPEFPEVMFDDLVAAAGDRIGQRVLEVGAGTGRATLPLVRRGARIEVVEPSAEMLRVLSDRLDGEHLLGAVTLRQATFEDLQTSDGPFDVVVAAQSFHWADPGSRWGRLAGLLSDEGVAFLMWNGWRLDPTHHDLDAVKQVYRNEHADVLPDIEDHRGETQWAEDEVAAEPLLGAPAVTTYAWDLVLPVQDYLGLLATTSQYAVAAPDRRARLFRSLQSELGDTAWLKGRTNLLTVRGAAS